MTKAVEPRDVQPRSWRYVARLSVAAALLGGLACSGGTAEGALEDSGRPSDVDQTEVDTKGGGKKSPLDFASSSSALESGGWNVNDEETVPLQKVYRRTLSLSGKSEITLTTSNLSNTDTLLAVIRWREKKRGYDTNSGFDVVAFNDDYSGEASQVAFTPDGRSEYEVLVLPKRSSATPGTATLSATYANCASCGFTENVAVKGDVQRWSTGNTFEIDSTLGYHDPMLFAMRLVPKVEDPNTLVGEGVFNDDANDYWPKINSDLMLVGSEWDLLITSAYHSAAPDSATAHQLHGDERTLPVFDFSRPPNSSGCFAPTSDNDIPETLMATGCIQSSGEDFDAASGLMPYGVAHGFWSDGVVKERFFSIPDDKTIEIDINGNWTMPVGGLMMKNFRFGGRLFETRFVAQATASLQLTYTYKWDGNDAVRVDNKSESERTISLTGDAVLPDRSWTLPSTAECVACHNKDGKNEFYLGLNSRQFNIDFDYPDYGRDNQMDALESAGILSGAGAWDWNRSEPFPARPDTPQGVAYSTEQARAYVAVNCSYCHNTLKDAATPESVFGPVWDARFDTSFADMKVCNETPLINPMTRFDPGNPHGSRLFQRAGTRGSVGPDGGVAIDRQMPYLATAVQDTVGLALIERWITDTAASCDPKPVNIRSGSVCLTSTTGSTGSTVYWLGCNTSSDAQSFEVVDVGGGYVQLQMEHDIGCVFYNSDQDDVIRYACGAEGAAWRRVTHPSGWTEYRASSNDNLCLTTGSFTNVYATQCDGGPKQRWTTVPR